MIVADVAFDAEEQSTVALTPPAAGTERRQPGHHAVLGVAAFGAFMAFLDATVVNVAFPSIRVSFSHTSINELSWVLNAYNIAFAGLLVAWGRVADLLGRRRVFMTGLVVFTLASVLCGAAPSATFLIVFRVVQGVGAALLVPASLAMVVQAAPTDKRSHTISLWGAAAALAAGLGPPVGGALVDAWNWRLTFFINVPLGIAAWLLARRVLVESRSPGRRVAPDVLGALLLSVALAALTLGIVQGSTWGWRSPATILSFVAAAFCVVLLVRSSIHHRSPVLDPRLLRIRAFAVGNVVVVAAGFGLYTYLLAHILWLHYVWGYSLLKAGLAVAPGAVIAAIVAGPFGRLADRYGPRAVVVPGAIVWAAAYLWYVTRVGVQPEFLTQWLPGQVLSGIGVGATLPIASSGSLSSVPADRYATASAAVSSARQLGGVIGVAILTVFVAHATNVGLPAALRHGWELAGASFLVAAAVALFFGEAAPRTWGADDVVGNSPRVTALAPPAVEVPVPATETDLLAAVPADLRDQILAVGELVRIPAGGVLFRAGDPGDTMYLLRAGWLEVQGEDGTLGDVAPGAAVGELALLSQSRRSATIVARRDSDLIRISAADFGRLVEQHPQVLLPIAAVLARQLQLRMPVGSGRRSSPKVVAIVAVDAGVVPEVIARVAEIVFFALRERARVVCVNEVSPEELERAEVENDRVVLVAGPSGPWHDSCIRQADRVLLVTSGSAPVAVPGIAPGADVVICGTAASRAEILGWVEMTKCHQVHNLGSDRDSWADQLRPVTAKLGGRSLAIALGGGGARALAHLGVLEAIESAGLVVDRISGSSMAAFIAALYGTGRSAREVDAIVFEEFVRARPFSDYTLPITSLVRGKRGLAMLDRCFGDLHFEELPRELVIVSSDLYARTPVYHGTGEVGRAVAASICLPVLFPPRRYDERTLVDGSLTDNCPSAPFTKLDEGPVIEVRIGTSSIESRSSGRTPGLGETLVRVMMMADRSVAPAGNAEGVALRVTPDTRGIGLLEFHQIDAAREAGLRAGEAAVAALRESFWADRLAPIATAK